MIARTSLNGCFYVVSKHRNDLTFFCSQANLNPAWIRYNRIRKKFYMRLWGGYKTRAKKIWDKLVIDQSGNGNHGVMVNFGLENNGT